MKINPKTATFATAGKDFKSIEKNVKAAYGVKGKQMGKDPTNL